MGAVMIALGKPKVVITGAGGMLGTDLRFCLLQSGFECYSFNRAQLDVTNELAVYRTVQQYKPAVLVNCSAYTNVALAENEREKAFKVNKNAVGFMAGACRKYGARMIHVSTDFVFDGKKGELYLEEDAPGPLNVYGESKLAGEEEARKNSDAVVLRVQGLYGLNGESFLRKILKKMSVGEAVQVVNDQYGCPTSTLFVSQVLRELICRKGVVGTYHLTHDNACTWYEFAKFATAQMGYKQEMLKEARTADFESSLKRPMDARMSKEKLQKELGVMSFGRWEEDLSMFMAMVLTSDRARRSWLEN